MLNKFFRTNLGPQDARYRNALVNHGVISNVGSCVFSFVCVGGRKNGLAENVAMSKSDPSDK